MKYLFLCLAILGLTGCSFSGFSNDVLDLYDAIDNSYASNEDKFSYEITNIYSNGYAYYVEGKVTNKTSYDYSYIQISFDCYDKEGNNVGNAFDNNGSLKGHETWKFKAMSLDDGVDHCKFNEISSW